VKKGESLKDTIETIESLGIDAVVLRHASSGAAHQVAGWVKDARVINAGDGTHEHPSQALIDLFTVRRALAQRRGMDSRGSGLTPLEGARVLIIGDIVHSRVARSEMLAYAKAGAEVRVIGPGTLVPRDVGVFGAERVEHLDEELAKADVVSLLRMQEERGSGSFVPSLHEFSALYGIDDRRAGLIRDDAVITHPGPMVRGVEVASSVADDPRMLVRRQVTNGVPIRMAILFLALSTPGEMSYV
jgi:aspartate carbamoyltransferase catalytic subunit